MAKLTKAEKILQLKVEKIIYEVIANVQLDLFDLHKVHQEGMRAAKSWTEASNVSSFDEAVRSAVSTIVTKLRKN